MPAVCFYFQVHQPFRLRGYRAGDIGKDHDYFDEGQNAAILRKVVNKSYLPANRKMMDLIRRHPGQFRFAFSLSGVVVEQMHAYAPEALASFQELVATGAVEILGETYFHSLASLYEDEEFVLQVRAHSDFMQATFGVSPRVFRNTELIYDDRIAGLVKNMGFDALLAEGADDVLAGRSPNFVYQAPNNGLKILLKNYRLSDDVAFRFSNGAWPEYPLTADKYVNWLRRVEGAGDLVGLFMDYETFGEHQWAETGIFDFLDDLPGKLLRHKQWSFTTPSEAITRFKSAGVLSFPRTVSWADSERDVSAWRGNNMQQLALERLYALSDAVRRRDDPYLSDAWRRLQTSDHFYYMCTKWFADGDVHAYFSPYESPYEAFINAMNVIEDFQIAVLGVPREPLPIAS
ncbi:MAG TPA: glycoside hydrolase family 57 protein [Polyangiaceae bacterium]|nr:glycoside hydrolase family 57 protein [Polyangiaceae bacterium]